MQWAIVVNLRMGGWPKSGSGYHPLPELMRQAKERREKHSEDACNKVRRLMGRYQQKQKTVECAAGNSSNCAKKRTRRASGTRSEGWTHLAADRSPNLSSWAGEAAHQQGQARRAPDQILVRVLPFALMHPETRSARERGDSAHPSAETLRVGLTSG